MACQTANLIIGTPVGPMTSVSCKVGLHELSFRPEVDENFKLGAKMTVEPRGPKSDDQDIAAIQDKTVSWLQHYFADPASLNPTKIPPLCGTVAPFFENKPESFSDRVLCTLYQKIPVGSMISYGDLAKLCQNDKAARAVGSCMRRNRFPLIIPCHRVITSNGSLGNYSSGKRNNVKQWLLDHEKKSLAKKS